eukprot:TRINITY_DN29612_c0_g1_i1.p1 TRINITY_DN29612_c0_g1~~TRINITY_DN29612_c0_g1_i1.p1  ORF type:complete len:398 (-),score=75.71 TRINITY_DN29612_c0_g1_i1:117-1310(-)
MSVSTECLPLGMHGSGLLLFFFMLVKSSINLLLVVSKEGHKDGFPFLLETVMFFPMLMQIVLYASQACRDLGLEKAMMAIKAAGPSMGPCALFSMFVIVTNILDTFCMQYIPPSMFVVLKQLTMVVIALGEVVFFAARPSQTAWTLIASQAFCVGLFQYLSASISPAGEAASVTSETAIGVSACLVSTVTGGLGNILQQRFMQNQAKHIPISVKLLYQHIFSWAVLVLLLGCKPENYNRFQAHGFFGGWNKWAVASSAAMWFSFLSASAVSTYISAIAGAFAVAVSVATTGVLEFVFLGQSFSMSQLSLMILVCVVAVLYTVERMRVLSGQDQKQGTQSMERQKELDGKRFEDVRQKTKSGMDVTGLIERQSLSKSAKKRASSPGIRIPSSVDESPR